MACPCFYPVERVPPVAGQKAAPMPLGDAWCGICQAEPESEWRPDPGTLQQLCNFGYAKEKCGHFPGGGPDAVRFTIARDQDGVIRISWVVEKDHLPFAHGPLEYSRADGCFTTAHPDARIAQQAHAYLSSYLRRKQDSTG